MTREYNHYFKPVAGLTHVDVYRVLQLFGVTAARNQEIAGGGWSRYKRHYQGRTRSNRQLGTLA
jgi:hypothetical protein